MEKKSKSSGPRKRQGNTQGKQPPKRPIGRPRLADEPLAGVRVVMPESLLAALDQSAHAAGRNRSAEIRAAIEAHVAGGRARK